MPLSTQQKAYCEHRAFQTLDPIPAYRAAYDCSKLPPRTITVRAESLETRPDIQEHIAVLRARRNGESTEAKAYNLDQAMREAEEARLLAMRKGQAAAARSAVELRAKLAGLIVEKKEVKQTHGLDDAEVSVLKKMRDQVAEQIQRLKDAATLTEQAQSVENPSLYRKAA